MRLVADDGANGNRQKQRGNSEPGKRRGLHVIASVVFAEGNGAWSERLRRRANRISVGVRVLLFCYVGIRPR
jgi:hypothetical protein